MHRGASGISGRCRAREMQPCVEAVQQVVSTVPTVCRHDFDRAHGAGEPNEVAINLDVQRTSFHRAHQAVSHQSIQARNGPSHGALQAGNVRVRADLSSWLASRTRTNDHMRCTQIGGRTAYLADGGRARLPRHRLLVRTRNSGCRRSSVAAEDLLACSRSPVGFQKSVTHGRHWFHGHQLGGGSVRLGHVGTWGRWSEPGAVQAAAATPVTSFQVVNRWLISRRHSEPDIRCRPGRKYDLTWLTIAGPS